MADDITLSIVSLVSVAVGGGISFVAQWVIQRLETQRHAATVAEARRVDRLSRLIEFLEAAQAAERIAMERAAMREPDNDWRQRAGIALDRLWTAQKTVHLLCSANVTEAAHSFARTVQDAVRGDEPDDPLWDQIRPSRRMFLDEARTDLDRVPV